MSFKPYYKWITFNTQKVWMFELVKGLFGFKPYYKWITFNTPKPTISEDLDFSVLNLIINGLPSILKISIMMRLQSLELSFKPYYKWITFNTLDFSFKTPISLNIVLNLIINGLPSIRLKHQKDFLKLKSFKPYYKWITFNT